MDWSALLQQYGYFAILVGAFFEGETILLLGAYAVHQHLMNFWWLIVVAMLGSFFGDQFYYFLGRKFGFDFFKKRPQLISKFDQASVFIDRYPILTILLMRFAWGLRTAIPISFGIKRYPFILYAVVNLLACFIWAFTIVTMGMQFSHWLHQLWQNILLHELEDRIFLFVSLTMILISIVIIFILHQKKYRD